MSNLSIQSKNRSRRRWYGFAMLAVFSVGLVGLWSKGTQADLNNGPGGGERRVTKLVAGQLERLHLARRPLDDKLSAMCLDSFLKTLDPMKVHFLQSDVDEFSRWRTQIDDQIKQGDIHLAYTIFKRFLQRIDDRNRIVEKLLDSELDFTIEETMVTDRDLRQYPKDWDEAQEKWRKRVKYDLLVQKSEGLDLAEAKEKIRRRYRSFAKQMRQTDNDELLEMWLTSLTTGFDPHTTYMSASTLENFEIQMRLELDGIGASLKLDDGYTMVHRIIPGGAADRDGQLKVEDKIVAVGQGDGGEMVDVVDMKLGEVVKLIRGKRGTVVRLGVVPAAGKKQVTYDITRDRIELKDSQARGQVFDDLKKADGSPLIVGVIDLPSFYMDMAAAREGRRDFRSTTRDVRRILEEFRQKNVEAIIIDLRRNGGGSLTESVNLTGLFIESGPVVQVKGFNGSVEPYDDRDLSMAWDGPLVVLTSKFSASASEIFAGAIQDYRRGLIVGDKTTHGKGTVQQLLDLGRQMFHNLPNAPSLGALKITIQQFYRPDGDSTQNRGVVSDIELPSLTTHLDVGESDLDNALAFNRVAGVPHKSYGQVGANLVANLEARSHARTESSEDFKKVLADIKRYKEQKERKAVTLHEEKFLAERAELDAEREQEKKFEELNDPNRPIVKRDYYFNEALDITRDYVDLLEKNKIAQAR